MPVECVHGEVDRPDLEFIWNESIHIKSVKRRVNDVITPASTACLRAALQSRTSLVPMCPGSEARAAWPKPVEPLEPGGRKIWEIREIQGSGSVGRNLGAKSFSEQSIPISARDLNLEDKVSSTSSSEISFLDPAYPRHQFTHILAHALLARPSQLARTCS